jgi:hypothetical protein
VDLYMYSPIHLHGVALNQLSTGTTLPLPLAYLTHLSVCDLFNDDISYVPTRFGSTGADLWVV